MGIPLPNDEQLGRIEALADAGRFVEAHASASSFAPYEAWRGPRAEFLAGLLTHYLGAVERSSRIGLAAYRRTPNALGAYAEYLSEVASRRGPLIASLRFRGKTALTGSEAERAHLLRCRISIHSALRDFETAFGLANELEESTGLDARAFELRAALLDATDRTEEALALHAKLAPDVQRNFRARRAHARTHISLGNVAGAQSVLGDDPVGDLFELRAVVALTREDFDAAERALAQAERAMPLLEGAALNLLRLRRFDLAVRRGRIEEAIERATELGAMETVARLRARPTGARRVVLDVPYVRQDLLTCAPATLTAISLFFGKHAEHDEIAAAICYDGTPHHAQRRWAEANGFVVREFRADEPSVKALLDAGVPFALASVEATSAHVRVVIGYDETHGTLVFRESQTPIPVEVLAQPFLARYRSTGPRAMAFVPLVDEARVATLRATKLPDAELYDRLHEVDRALDEHRRDDAAAAAERIAHDAPQTVVACLARRSLAQYDGDEAALAIVARDALVLHPESDFWRSLAARAVPNTIDHEARIAALVALNREGDEDPFFREKLAVERARDSRAIQDSRRVLLRSASAHPGRPGPLVDLANLERRAGKGELAAEFLHLAACVAPLDESLALAAAGSLHAVGERERALAFLDARIARIARAAPKLTKARFLAETGHRDESSALVEQTLAATSEPAALADAAQFFASWNQASRARALCEAAEAKLSRIDWLRAAANVAESLGDAALALTHHREVLLLAPSDPTAHAALTRAALEQGPHAALRYIDEVCARFPASRQLRSLRLQAARSLPPAERAEALEAHLAEEPSDAWALRELTHVRLARGETAAARVVMDRALAVEPQSAASQSARGAVLVAEGKRVEAIEAFREAVALAPDEPAFARSLLAHVEGREEVERALAWIAEQAERRSFDGTAVETYYDLAWPILGDDELRATLVRLRDARPDDWAPRAAFARHCARVGARAEARAELEKARVAFPAEAALEDVAADFAAEVGDLSGLLGALDRAIELAPTPARLLRRATALDARGETDRAEAARAEAFRRAPFAPSLVAWAAEREAARGDVEAAIERLRRYVATFPDPDEPWAMLRNVGNANGRPRLALDVARELAQTNAWNPEAILAYAHEAWTIGDRAAAFAALEQGRIAHPREMKIVDSLAVYLTAAGRSDEALHVCASLTADFRMRGRFAWIEAQRQQYVAAIALLEPIVFERPTYAWGAAELATWYEKTGDLPRRHYWARRVAALSPDLAVAQFRLANAAWDVGAVEESLAAARRATQLEPMNGPLVDELAARLLSAGEVDAARDVLTTTSSPSSERRELLGLHAMVAKADTVAAMDALRSILEAKGSSPGLVREALHAALETGAPEEVDAILTATFRTTPRPEVAQILLARGIADGHSGVDVVRWYAAKSETHELVAAAYVKELAAKKDTNGLAWLVVRNFRMVRRSEALWAEVTDALWKLEWVIPLTLWTRGWERRERTAVSQKAYVCLALAHLGRGSSTLARRVSTIVLDGAPESYAMIHKSLLALQDAARGDFEFARTRLAQVDPAKMGEFYAAITRMTARICDGRIEEINDAISEFIHSTMKFGGSSISALTELGRVAVLRRSRASALRIFFETLRLATVVKVVVVASVLGLGALAFVSTDAFYVGLFGLVFCAMVGIVVFVLTRRVD